MIGSPVLYSLFLALLLAGVAAVECWRSSTPPRLRAVVTSVGLLLIIALAFSISAILTTAEDRNAIGRTFRAKMDSLYDLQAEMYMTTLLSQPRYQAPGRLNRYERKVYSQAGEDGIIAEIFHRIGTTNRRFVDFGSSDGSENNTVWLLRNGWGGLWIDADRSAVSKARAAFAPEIHTGRLAVDRNFITAENIEAIFATQRVPKSFDLLSIDIDGNDYWVWRAITRYRPRAVVIEYNSTFPPDSNWVYPYKPDFHWDGTTRFGASLKALELLGREKRYSLVACNTGGANAFFVADELVGKKFAEPFTAENHYEPGRPALQIRHAWLERKP